MAYTIIGLVLVFLISPIVGILLSMMVALKSQISQMFIPFIVFCSLYMGALNSTKVPESDMVVYVKQFETAPKGYENTLKSLSGDAKRIKSPLYGTLVYVLYYLTMGSEGLFIAIISFLTYFLFLYSVYKLQKEYDASNYIIVSGVLTIVFFTQYFTLTAHLVRQMLATSILFYALTFKGKNWRAFGGLLVCSYFIHSSMALPIIITIIPSINWYYTKMQIILLGVLFCVGTIMLTTIAGYLLENIALGGEMGVAVDRVASEDYYSQGNSLSRSILLMITLPLMGLSLWGMIKGIEWIPPIVLNFCFLWCIIVLSLSFSPLIQYRFFYILYYFIPFVLFLLFRNNVKFSVLFCIVICLFMIVRFYLTYSDVFTYTAIENALLLPYPLLINI